jgi:hypothetical protein
VACILVGIKNPAFIKWFIPTGERTSRLRTRASRADNTSDHLDSDAAMDENIQINSAAHNIEGVLLI